MQILIQLFGIRTKLEISPSNPTKKELKYLFVLGTGTTVQCVGDLSRGGWRLLLNVSIAGSYVAQCNSFFLFVWYSHLCIRLLSDQKPSCTAVFNFCFPVLTTSLVNSTGNILLVMAYLGLT